MKNQTAPRIGIRDALVALLSKDKRNKDPYSDLIGKEVLVEDKEATNRYAFAILEKSEGDILSFNFYMAHPNYDPERIASALRNKTQMRMYNAIFYGKRVVPKSQVSVSLLSDVLQGAKYDDVFEEWM